jgi:hypothetical protein
MKSGGGEQSRQGGMAGQAAEPVDLSKLHESCWDNFCGLLNYNIRQNNHTDKLTLDFQGRDCRVMECNADGTCLVDVPGGEPQALAMKPEDCTRLTEVCCGMPPGSLSIFAGGRHRTES